MKKRHGHPDDVQIGHDEWIPFVDVSGRTASAISVDSYISPIETFWRSLEVNCVSECCGINAHSLLPKDIWNGVRSFDDSTLIPKLNSLRDHIASLDDDCVVSEILNQYFDRTMFVDLLNHVIATVNRM